MNMIRIRLAKIAFSVCAAALMVPSFASAQNDFYALYNRHLSHSTMLSPRSAAMGGVYSALKGGDMGLLGNPASVGMTEERYATILGNFMEVSSDISMMDPGLGTNLTSKTEADLWGVGVGFTMPYEWGGLGLMYDYRSDDYDSDAFNASIGRLVQSSDLERHSVGVTGAYRFQDNMAVGYRYSFIDWDNDLDLTMVSPGPVANLATIKEDFTGHKNHVGYQVQANELVTLGLDGYYGFGDQDSSLGDADSDSYAIRAGAAWMYGSDMPLLVALDVKYESRDLDGIGLNVDDDLWGIHVGVEYEVQDDIFLRCGYQLEDFDYQDSLNAINESPTISTWSLGFGYTTEQFTLDYGFMYVDTGDADMVHVIGLGMKF
jgi:long-subunit fatty acid transport protein